MLRLPQPTRKNFQERFARFSKKKQWRFLPWVVWGSGRGEVGQVKKEEALRFALANDHSEAEAVLIPDTALHTVAFLTELENLLGKTVLTANQVTFWEALRLAGRLKPQTGLGRLFEDAVGGS